MDRDDVLDGICLLQVCYDGCLDDWYNAGFGAPSHGNMDQMVEDALDMIVDRHDAYVRAGKMVHAADMRRAYLGLDALLGGGGAGRNYSALDAYGFLWRDEAMDV